MTAEQQSRILHLTSSLKQRAALFYGKETDVLHAAKLESIVPQNVSLFSELTYKEADDLIYWLEDASVESRASGAYPD